MLRSRDIPTHTTELLALTSVTVDEFAALVPPFCVDIARTEHTQEHYKTYRSPVTNASHCRSPHRG